MDVLQRFLAFYQAFHAGVCDDCYRESFNAIYRLDPCWFQHSKCSDAYRYLRLLFIEQLEAAGTEVVNFAGYQ